MVTISPNMNMAFAMFHENHKGKVSGIDMCNLFMYFYKYIIVDGHSK